MNFQVHLRSFLTLYILILIHGISSAQINKRDVTQEWSTDTSKVSIAKDELWILLKRDRIPPLDAPRFIELDEAGELFFEYEPVIAVVIEGEASGYPLSILTYHELVNDSIGDTYFSVSYCPLCNSAVVFNRSLDFEGETYLLDFGTSGMIRKSNLVMWDRQTESWWQQITGQAVAGVLNGAELVMMPSQIISVRDFLNEYPGGKLLSTETGHNRKYGENPYEAYDDTSNTKPRLFGEMTDDRLPAMERVVHVFGEKTPKVYPLTLMKEKKVINDSHEGLDIVVFFTDGMVSILDTREINKARTLGSVTVFSPWIDNKKLNFSTDGETFRDNETLSEWSTTGKCIDGEYKGRQLKTLVYGNHFAFAWLAFYPESVIYGD